MSSVSVVSVKSFGWVGVEYVGRGKGSVLGNKFKIGVDGDRKEVIEKYKSWLWRYVKEGIKGVMSDVWKELLRICKKVKEGGDVVLGCWCSPLGCHGDVIKSCILWMLKEGLV